MDSRSYDNNFNKSITDPEHYSRPHNALIETFKTLNFKGAIVSCE